VPETSESAAPIGVGNSGGYYLTVEEKAREIGVRATLYRWRRAGTGPAWVRLGPKLVRYLPENSVTP
jgi:hypothetical protein